MTAMMDAGAANGTSDPQVGRRVHGDGGWNGSLLEVVPAGSGTGAPRARVVVEPSGLNVLIPLELFQEQSDGSLYLPLSREALGLVAATDAAGLSAAETVVSAANGATSATERLVVPVIAEEVLVTRERVPSGGVRVHKTITERQEVIEQPVYRDEVSVERVPVNRVVEEGAAPRVRQEGDVMIVPLLEEVIVVEKRMMVREELRIQLRRVIDQDSQTVTLRREEAQVERFSAPESGQVQGQAGVGAVADPSTSARTTLEGR